MKKPNQKKRKNLSQRLSSVITRFDGVNTYFIQDVASQIASIRDDETVEFILLLALLNANMAAVNARIDSAVKQSAKDIGEIYKAAVKDTINDQRFREALNETPLSQNAIDDIDAHRKAVERDTGRVLRRLSSANNVSQTYKQVANRAVVARKGGLGDYEGQMRPVVRDLGRTGLTINGDDGRNYSIKAAVNRCIQDGIYDIEQYTNNVIGGELKFDAVEISVHNNPAPDHEPFQGHIFMRSEFNRLQNHEGFVDIDGVRYPAQVRAVGELNCRHLAFPFSTKYGKRRYSPNDLRIMTARNKRGCYINGKHYTLYEATQYMNRLDAERKRNTNMMLAAQAANDAFLEKQAKDRIKIIEEQLAKASKAVEASLKVGSASKNYKEITEKWTVNSKGSNGKSKDLDHIVAKGKTYYVHGTEVRFEYDPHEKAVADMVARKTGFNVFMLPKINQPQGMKSADNLIDGEYYDLKTLTKEASENTIFQRVKSAKGQATNVILDITKGNVSDELLDSQVEKIFWSKNTMFIDKIVIVRDMDIVHVFQRTKKGLSVARSL